MPGFFSYDAAPFVVNVIAQSTVALAATLVVEWIARRHATARNVVLVCGLVAVLMIPVLTAMQAHLGFALVSLPVDFGAESRPVVSRLSEALSPPSRDQPRFGGVAGELPIEDESATSGHLDTALSHRFLKPHGQRMNIMSAGSILRPVLFFVFVIWLIGSFIIVLRYVSAWLALRRLRGQATTSHHPVLRAALALVRKWGRDKLPTVLTCRRLKTPLAAGLLRPYVLLPESVLGSFTPTQLRDVLMHEFAHVYRHDVAVVCLERLATLLFWFNPLVHRLNHLLHVSREDICDNYVLECSDALEYSRMLLSLNGQAGTEPSSALATCLLNGPRKLEDRIRDILDERRIPMTRLSLLRKVAIAVLFVVGVAVLTAIRSVSYADERQVNDDKRYVPATPGELKYIAQQAAPGPGGAMDEKLKDELRGGWFITHVEQNGKPDPRLDPPLLKEEQFTAFVTDDTINLKMFTDLVRPQSVRGEASELGYKLDSTKELKRIELTVLDGAIKGRTIQGIYSVEADVLKICLAADGRPGAAPPTEFKTNPASGHVLIVLQKTDNEKLQGNWSVLKNEEDGKERDIVPAHLVIDDGKITIPSFIWQAEYTFTLDANKDPKWINLTDAGPEDEGETSQGIYELKGDMLVLCVARAGKERPREFSSNAGSGDRLVLLQRGAPEKSEGTPREQQAKEAQRETNAIDDLVLRRLKERLAGTGQATDADFLRRTYLDIQGTVASPEEVEKFVKDQDPDKRTKLIDKLLEDPDSQRGIPWSTFERWMHIEATTKVGARRGVGAADLDDDGQIDINVIGENESALSDEERKLLLAKEVLRLLPPADAGEDNAEIRRLIETGQVPEERLLELRRKYERDSESRESRPQPESERGSGANLSPPGLPVIIFNDSSFSTRLPAEEKPGKPGVFTPEQIAKERPEGQVTVNFRVESVGLLIGDPQDGEPPYLPIQIVAGAKLKHTRDKFYVVLTGGALARVHELGINSPAEHFRGKEVSATGTIRYFKLPRITRPDLSVEVPPDSWTHFEMVIDNPDRFEAVR